MVRVCLDELLALERAGSIRWVEPRGFSLAGNRLPEPDFVLEFEALSGRTYVCVVTKVEPDAVQLDCPAENISGIWFAHVAAQRETTDRRPSAAQEHEIRYLARKHGTSVEKVWAVIRQTSSRSREQTEAALEEEFGHVPASRPAKRSQERS